MLPPRWLRLSILAPAVPLLAVLAVTSLPVTVMVALAISPLIPGRWRPLRLLLFVLVWLGVEAIAIACLTALWCLRAVRAVGQERYLAAHDHLMRRYLAALMHMAERAFRLRVELDGDVDALEPGPVDATSGEHVGTSASRPLVVLSRHAGPGDSFVLLDLLMQRGWRPRVVLREVLRWLPGVDVAFHRLPMVFVERAAPPGTVTRAVGRLAAGLGAGDALVLFPEGLNFTARRRQHSIDRLEELGRHDEAEAARQMRHVLSPRVAGTAAALTAAPQADVAFVAHAGLEGLSGVVDLWRGLPMDSRVKVMIWSVPADQVPREVEAIGAWLHGWWRTIDRWLVDHHGPAAVPDAVVEAVTRDDAPPSSR